MQPYHKKLFRWLSSLTPRYCLVASVSLIVFSVVMDWLIIPNIINLILAKQINLNAGGIIRKWWTKPPIALEFKLFMFNITNPEEVLNGAIPEVKEVGPYVYEDYREKVDLTENLEEDTISYNNKVTWYFLKNQSYPLTGEEVISTVHFPFSGITLAVELDFPEGMGLLSVALEEVLGHVKPIAQYKVREILFDGVRLDCIPKSLVSRGLCAAIQKRNRAMIEVAPFKYKYSFLGMKNGTVDPQRLTVSQGSGNGWDVGRVVKWNGMPESGVWSRLLPGNCNKLIGTDSTIFPPRREPNNHSIYAFSADICRAMRGLYVGDGEYQGVKGYMYTVDFEDAGTTPGHKCFCPRPSKCPKKGAMSIFKCYDAPIIASFPHFYDGDESYLAGVKGLRPEKEKHQTIVLIEPNSGTPLWGKRRLQLNIEVHRLKHFNQTSKLRSTLLPIAWLEETFELGDYIMGYLYYRFLVYLKIIDGITWTLLTLGVLSGAHGLFLYGKRRRAAMVRVDQEEGRVEVFRKDQLERLGRHVAVQLSATVGGHTLSKSLAEEIFRILRQSQDNQRPATNEVALPSPTPTAIDPR